MAGWWQRVLRRPEVQALDLRYFVDVDDAGRQVVRIYRQRGEMRQAIADVRPLFQYGYQEQVDGGSRVYVLRAEDWQILQALKSQNPKIRPDGALVFDVLPPVLRYLRGRPEVQQTPQAEALHIEARPLRPAAMIDYDPEAGLMVRTGLRAPGSTEVIPAQRLETTRDGGYARVGNQFVPLPRRLGQAVQSWLQRGSAQIPPEQVPEFFVRDMVLLKTQFGAVLTDQAAQVRVVQEPPEPAVSVEMHEQGWLDFKVDYQGDGYSLPQGLLAGKKSGERFHRLDPHTWVAVDPTAVRAAQEKLAKMGAVQSPEGYRVPASQFADLEDFIRQMGGRANLSTAYQQFLDQLTGFQPDESYPLSPAAEEDLRRAGVTLRPYQRGGIHWLRWLHANGLHGILADDMGLGKTIQAIAALRAAYEASAAKQHSLILAPKSVLAHWERELQRYYPAMQAYRYHGAERQRELLAAAEPHIFITTYGTAAADIEYLAGIPFFYVILDEATQIKNPDTQRTVAVKALNAGHRLALSGTPLENRPAEVWSLFDFLMRGYLGTQGAFDRLFEDPIMAGDRGAAARLGHRIRPFTLRRTKEKVAKDLPEKIELQEWCDLTAEQRVLYGGLQDETRRIREALERGEHVNYTVNVLPVIQKLKQICDHPALVTGEPLPKPVAPVQPAPPVPANGEGPAGGRPAVPGQKSLPGGIVPANAPAADPRQSQRTDTEAPTRDAGYTGAQAAGLPTPQTPAAGRQVDSWHETRSREQSAGTDGADRQEQTAPTETAPLSALSSTDTPEPAAGPATSRKAAVQPGDEEAESGMTATPAATADEERLFGRSEKFDWIVATVVKIVQGGEQVVVFSHFLGMLTLLEAALVRSGITYIRIDGSTDNRQALIDRFNAHQAHVALCSILAAGYGINLTAGNHVIHADRWWNPAVEDQATDRVHRIGQDRTVYVHLILTEGTLEERIDQLLESKRGMADRIIDAAHSGPGGWTREELITLLQPLA